MWLVASLTSGGGRSSVAGISLTASAADTGSSCSFFSSDSAGTAASISLSASRSSSLSDSSMKGPLRWMDPLALPCFFFSSFDSPSENRDDDETFRLLTDPPFSLNRFSSSSRSVNRLSPSLSSCPSPHRESSSGVFDLSLMEPSLTSPLTPSPSPLSLLPRRSSRNKPPLSAFL